MTIVYFEAHKYKLAISSTLAVIASPQTQFMDVPVGIFCFWLFDSGFMFLTHVDDAASAYDVPVALGLRACIADKRTACLYAWSSVSGSTSRIL